eukprot:TRINITY_DN3726_c0_g1_i1.p2 TRINITY_DN3726_c0_g1~~TRINITY_DN3726_c0_g1_i1.p2  ORF type:complete len:107 (-),score=6.75 TRINITY_DN3726_c0_g1_i1:102-422(-)
MYRGDRRGTSSHHRGLQHQRPESVSALLLRECGGSCRLQSLGNGRVLLHLVRTRLGRRSFFLRLLWAFPLPYSTHHTAAGARINTRTGDGTHTPRIVPASQPPTPP